MDDETPVHRGCLVGELIFLESLLSGIWVPTQTATFTADTYSSPCVLLLWHDSKKIRINGVSFIFHFSLWHSFFILRNLLKLLSNWQLFPQFSQKCFPKVSKNPLPANPMDFSVLQLAVSHTKQKRKKFEHMPGAPYDTNTLFVSIFAICHVCFIPGF